MINKTAFLSKFPKFSSSMNVYLRDGSKLGRIIDSDDVSFTVEKGVFFPKDFTLRYDDISDIRDDKIFLRESSEDMRHWQDPTYSGWSKVEDVNVGRIAPLPTPEFREKYQAISEETVSIPVFEEEIEARKSEHRTGQVTVRKIVHTELRHLTVPLMHEEVHVERVPADRESITRYDSGELFKDQTINVPVMEEEVEISKRPIVREEVRVGKTRHTEQKDVSGEVRKEEVKIDEQVEKPSKKKAG